MCVKVLTLLFSLAVLSHYIRPIVMAWSSRDQMTDPLFWSGPSSSLPRYSLVFPSQKDIYKAPIHHLSSRQISSYPPNLSTMSSDVRCSAVRAAMARQGELWYLFDHKHHANQKLPVRKDVRSDRDRNWINRAKGNWQWVLFLISTLITASSMTRANSKKKYSPCVLNSLQRQRPGNWQWIPVSWSSPWNRRQRESQP